MRGERGGESKRGQSERALSIYSPCAQSEGRLLFKSTFGVYDFVLQYTGCRSEDAGTERIHATQIIHPVGSKMGHYWEN